MKLSFDWFGNVAVTLNSKIGNSERQVEISNDEDWRFVHGLRNESKGIVVGSGTVITDNSTLLVIKEYISPKFLKS